MYSITIVLKENKLYLLEGKKVVKFYGVGVGKALVPTPTGSYEVIEKIKNPGGPYGTRFIRFFKSYGIHGTGDGERHMKAVSNGCVRMRNNDVEELFDGIDIGTKIEIRYKQD